MPDIFLIITVGTGTRGPHSSLVDGLRTTIELTKPTQFWLIPSLDKESIATADLVREGFGCFRPWEKNIPYRHIHEHDSLSYCREVMREVICSAKESLKKGDRLIVNPTSGTKQMSAGATVAALDENVGELMFTIGERSDGVVKTGTEKLETFVAAHYFAERDLILATELYLTGSYGEAARVLQPHRDVFPAELALCRCIHPWEQLDYAEALRIARTKSHPLFDNFIHHLRPLAGDATQKKSTARLAMELHKSATRLHALGKYPDALFRACKAYETAARADLQERTGINEPYCRDKLLKAKDTLPLKLYERVLRSQHDTIHLSLAEIAGILITLGSPTGKSYKTPSLKTAISIRHELAHAVRPVSQKESRTALDAIQQAIQPLAGPIPANIPATLQST